MYFPPNCCGARPGDIVHVRTESFYGHAIRAVLSGAWGNHDAILAFDESAKKYVVCEALPGSGFVATPWGDYVCDIEAGKCSLVFMRVPHLPDNVAGFISRQAVERTKRKIRYDRKAIFWIAWNLLFHAKSRRNHEHKWYCTEAVRDLYADAANYILGDWDIWGPGLPTPLTTEIRQRAGRLAVIRSQYDAMLIAAADIPYPGEAA